MRNRLDQQTEQWRRRYAIRPGIESTLYQNVRAHGLRRGRYRGLPRTHVQHVLTAMARNLSRLADWHDTTSSTGRTPRFQTLCTAAGFTTLRPLEITIRDTALALASAHAFTSQP